MGKSAVRKPAAAAGAKKKPAAKAKAPAAATGMKKKPAARKPARSGEAQS